MGLFDSTSKKYGGPAGSSDSIANNNAGASAPVFNIIDERKGSGKVVQQAGNNIKFEVVNTDYGAIGSAFDFVEDFSGDAFEFGRDAFDFAESVSADYIDFAENSRQDAFLLGGDALRFAERESEQNRQLLSDSLTSVESAYWNANRGILSAAESSNDAVLSIARESNKAIGNAFQTANEKIAEFAQFAQDSSTTALDYVFNSSKGSTERLTENVFKTGAIVTGVVVVAGLLLGLRK